MNGKYGGFKITTLDRYIFKELFGVFIVGLSIVMSILLLEKIHFLSRLILNKGITLDEFGRLLLYISPAFLVVAIPLAMLLSSLITFARLSTDNEITAMRACGIGFHRFLLPVLVLSLLVYAVNLHLSVNAQHAGNYKYMKLLRTILTEKLAMSLGERVFFDQMKNTVVYVNEKELDSDLLKGLFIFDEHNPKKPKYITAETGRFVNVNDQVILQLHNGTIYTGDYGAFRTTGYGKYELVFDTNPENGSEYVIQPREMSIAEMRERVEKRKKEKTDYHGDEVEIYKRFSLPFSCIVLALLGAPLGIRSQRGSKWSGMSTGITMIIVNYLLLMLMEGLGREGTVEPLLAMWVPNIVMGSLALYLIYITSKEITPMKLFGWIEPLLTLFRRKKAKA